MDSRYYLMPPNTLTQESPVLVWIPVREKKEKVDHE